ncbi:MAG: DUF3232 domain-containing protein [Ruminococcaceae bacterium]|nr:DUF3232 domain-containing protein [Oscillospiraceae bacterium]
MGKNAINIENLEALIKACSAERDDLDIIFSVIQKIEAYHSAIVEMEARLKIYSDAWDREEKQEWFSSLDNNRTKCHNGVISAVSMLNKLAAKKGIGPIFDGVVSEEKPYRRILADAVFDYFDKIIAERI